MTKNKAVDIALSCMDAEARRALAAKDMKRADEIFAAMREIKRLAAQGVMEI